ncbi:hypothetical protein [Streptomyces klenkii]|uniref:hypothetical protein n=1 Tax=Streptomyces klenkii TaxID=1420899 RepID=UPI003447CCBB
MPASPAAKAHGLPARSHGTGHRHCLPRLPGHHRPRAPLRDRLLTLTGSAACAPHQPRRTGALRTVIV